MPETQLYGGLTRRPIFVPSVGHFRQGMLVSVPLHLDTLPGRPTGADLHAVLAARYAGCDLVRVVPPPADGKLEPEALNDTDRLELSVYANEKHRQAVLVARLDNLGKGASGAAVQNIGADARAACRRRRAGDGACLSCRMARFGPIFSLDGVTPMIAPDAFIAPTAAVIGDVVIGSETGIWFHCLVRGDLNSIRIGARTNIQDGTVIHVDSGGYVHLHRRRRDGRAQRGDPRLHVEEPRLRRHQRDGAGRRGDRGGRHARRRRPADARQGDRPERAMDRLAGEAAPRDGRRRNARGSIATPRCIASWRGSFGRG